MPASTPNVSPLFVYNPILAYNIISGSTSQHDYVTIPTGIMPTVIASGNSWGTRIEMIQIRATGTTTENVLRLWIDNSKATPVYPTTGIRLWNEVAITAVTASATAVGY